MQDKNVRKKTGPPRFWLKLLPVLLSEIDGNISRVYYRRGVYRNKSGNHNIEHRLEVLLRRHIPASEQRSLQLYLERLLSLKGDEAVRIRVSYRRPEDNSCHPGDAGGQFVGRSICIYDRAD